MVVLVSGLVLGGCAKQAPAPSQAPAPAPAKTEPLVLKFYNHEPDVKSASTEMMRRFAAQTEERTEGRVKIEMFWGGVLGKATDALKIVGGSGVADGGLVIATYHQWSTPLFASSGLPFLTNKSLIRIPNFSL